MKKLVIFLSFATVAFAFMDTTRCNNYKSHANEHAIEYKISHEDKDEKGMKNALRDFLFWNKKMIAICDKTTSEAAHALRKQLRENPNALLDISYDSLSDEQVIKQETNKILQTINPSPQYDITECKEAKKNEGFLLLGIALIIQEDDSSMKQEELTEAFNKVEKEFLKYNQIVIDSCPANEASKAKERQVTILKTLADTRKGYGL